MDQTAPLKIVILMVAFYVTFKSCYPPNRSKSGDKVERSTFLNKNIQILTPFIIVWLTLPILVEFIPTLLTLGPNLYADSVCPSFAASRPFNPHLVVALSSMIFGACIRLWCYRTLGKFFTFEVTIRPQHKLVKSGPYAFLRHPSYTGFFMVCIGGATLAWTPAGALTTCGFTTSPGVLTIRATWTLLMFLFLIIVVQRVGGEDQNLRQHFGKEWEAYAAKVKYALFPLIY